MKLKNSLVLNETKRHLSSNFIKVMLIVVLILSVISANEFSSFAMVKLYYYDEILSHYYWFGMDVILLSVFFISFKIIHESNKNYSLISRFENKKQFIKKMICINFLTVTIFVIVCYFSTFLAFNIFSDTSMEIKVLDFYNYAEIDYISNLAYLVFFLIRTLILFNLISVINIFLSYIFKKWKVLLFNIVTLFYLFEFKNNFQVGEYLKKSTLGFLDIKRFFRYPIYESFNIELTESILIIILLIVIIYLATNIVKYVKTIEQ